MRKSNRIQALLWAAFGLYITYQGFLLKLGTARAPKPGFMIFWMGVLIVILSTLFFIATFKLPAQEHKALWQGGLWHRGAKLMAALFVYVALFQLLGFIVSTFLLLVYLFKGLEPQSWRNALLLSAVTIAICYLVFGVFLELQFPPGVLKFILAT
jgi:putative tricarboxylic transport membrane protein